MTLSQRRIGRIIFDNHLFDECLTALGIKCLLSRESCPYDIGVAETTFKAIKTKFVSNTGFDSLE